MNHLTVRCNGVNSSDTDGVIEKYSWSIDDKVVSDTRFFHKTFDKANDYNVILRVEDDRGLYDDDIVTIHVLPGPTITPAPSSQPTKVVVAPVTPTPRPAKLSPTITPTSSPQPTLDRLRSRPATLSEYDVKAMLKKHSFFDSDRNKSGDF